MNTASLSVLLAGIAAAASLLWALVAFKYERPVLATLLGLSVLLAGALVSYPLGTENQGRTMVTGLLVIGAPTLLCLWTVMIVGGLREGTGTGDGADVGTDEDDGWDFD
ncbi:hypothetical protein ACWFMI_12080 [Nocardiopsis terrae]